MSLRHILHPWFDIPPVHELRKQCLSQGVDYISREGADTKAWDDARLEPRPGEALPWIFGPTIRRVDEDQAAVNEGLMRAILSHHAIEEHFILAVDHFKLVIGRDRVSLSFCVGRDRFRLSSETRHPEADPIAWLTGGGIHLEGVPHISATEEVEIGGARQHLIEQFEARPIRSALLSYELDEERDFSTMSNSLDFTKFQFNPEYTR